ncbi:MAG: ADP-ribosylglycohydrolase family protein [Bacteroidales bacterium]|nr:ADP-ribosylglycohydrolase family protein [Candidatus Cryptobacteroides onthequi]
MNRMIKAALFAAVLSLVPACLNAKTVKMSDKVLMDKIKGGWAGQTIGCTFGGPTEFKYTGRMIPDTTQIKWPDHYIKWYFDNIPGLYDDVYMDLTFVDVFAKKGLDAPIGEFANAFAHAGYKLWHANLQARANILAGIMPPESGHWMNNPHADDIDFQIEADYAGLMAPGMPNAAAFYCDEIGHMMNYGDGWYGGVYVAAMYSLAFVYDDIHKVVTDALEILPAQSRYARCIADVIRLYKEDPSDWKKAWEYCQEHYTDEVDCPSEPDNTFRIDAVINGAYIAIGLLYGEGDFEKTMEISTRCGQDSDCNPASAAGILATMTGYSAIPEKFMKDLREVEDINFAYTDISLNKTYRMSYDQAVEVIRRNGGKVTADGVKIKVQKPKAVRYEQSFEGLVFKGIQEVGRHAFDAPVEFKFTGSGVVLTGRLRNKQGGDYAAVVDIELDGKPYTTVNIIEDDYRGQDHIFHAYGLEDTEHTVKVSVRNPRADKKLWCGRLSIYRNR